MSFVRTLATLAAGYAAAKGFEKYKEMGGMAGVQKSMRDNPQMASASDQVGAMLEKMGVPGGAAGLQNMMDQWLGGAAKSGDAAAAGLGGLLTAITGAAATGTENAGKMMDAFTGKSAATNAMEENAKLMIRAMIQAAKADGEIDLEEQQKILAEARRDRARGAGLRRSRDAQARGHHGPRAGHGRRDEGAGLCDVADGGARRQRVRSCLPRRPRPGAWGSSDQTRTAVHKAMGLA